MFTCFRQPQTQLAHDVSVALPVFPVLIFHEDGIWSAESDVKLGTCTHRYYHGMTLVDSEFREYVLDGEPVVVDRGRFSIFFNRVQRVGLPLRQTETSWRLETLKEKVRQEIDAYDLAEEIWNVRLLKRKARSEVGG